MGTFPWPDRQALLPTLSTAPSQPPDEFRTGGLAGPG